jgi:predicted PilT family ATPase
MVFDYVYGWNEEEEYRIEEYLENKRMSYFEKSSLFFCEKMGRIGSRESRVW